MISHYVCFLLLDIKTIQGKMSIIIELYTNKIYKCFNYTLTHSNNSDILKTNIETF